MPQVLVLGSGKIGSLIAGLLSARWTWYCPLADLTLDAPKRLIDALALSTVTPCALDLRRPESVVDYVVAHGFDAVISSLPYFYNAAVADIARAHHLHYFDLTEDVAVTSRVKAISDGADRAFLPQCGLRARLHQYRVRTT